MLRQQLLLAFVMRCSTIKQKMVTGSYFWALL
jgi:hypothetical protein